MWKLRLVVAVVAYVASWRLTGARWLGVDDLGPAIAAGIGALLIYVVVMAVVRVVWSNPHRATPPADDLYGEDDWDTTHGPARGVPLKSGMTYYGRDPIAKSGDHHHW